MKKQKGIPYHTRYTRRYRGVLVEDYAWLSIMKKLQKQYPSLLFNDDSPLIAPHSKELGPSHKITVLKFPFGKRHVIKAHVDRMNNKWYFYDDEGNAIDIHKYLKKIKKVKR